MAVASRLLSLACAISILAARAASTAQTEPGVQDPAGAPTPSSASPSTPTPAEFGLRRGIRRGDGPGRSCRADYAIRVRFDEGPPRLTGEEVIQWHNESGDDVPDLWFHLYWNAFANNRSTHLVESGGELRGIEISDEWGWQRVTSIQVRGEELVSRLTWRPVDDGNTNDRTVFSVKPRERVRPGETVAITVRWEAQVPRVRRRTGYKDDFLFMAQWFPKLGVYEDGNGWNCHQFHANTEFFSDYGAYDVTLDLPAKYAGRIGASGVQVEPDVLAGDRVRARFVAPSPQDQLTPDTTGKLPLVHDFAWTADAQYVKREYTFRGTEWAARYTDEVDRVALALGRARAEVIPRDVAVTVLLQPEHADQADRHFDATCTALFFYGLWFGPYPYQHVTCVDPAYGAGAAGGMEYPTLFTAGARLNSWQRMHSPEGVTVHECGHQFWYGLVGNNEFEAAWLDEGFNTFTQNSALAKHYGDSARTSEFLGYFFDGVPLVREPGGRGLGEALTFKRWPLYALDVNPLSSSGALEWWRAQPLLTYSRGTNDTLWGERSGYLTSPDSDPVDLAGWQHVDSLSYRQNSYRRTAVNLRTLEGMVGSDRFLRGMRAYSEEYRYGHPYPQEFFDAFCVGAEADARDFLDQAFRSTATIDWSVEVKNERAKEPVGWFTDDAGVWKKRETKTADEKKPDDADADAPGARWRPEVIVRRKGGLYLPLKIEITWPGGRREEFLWSVEAQRRAAWWKPLEETGTTSAKVVSVVLDPEGVYFLDTDMSNNRWYDRTESATPLRWGERVLAQYAQLLHWFGGLGG